MRTGRRQLALFLLAALIASACGGGEEAGVQEEPPETQAAPTTEGTGLSEGSTTTAGGEGTATTEGEVVGDAAAALEEVRSAVEGQSVVIGTSSFPNSSLTGQFRTVRNLEEDFGLEVEFRLLDSAPLVSAMIAGQVQVGAQSLPRMAGANAAGSDFIAFGADDQKNTFTVVAKPPIETMEELAGRSFGVTQNLTGLTGQTAQLCLQQAGMTIDDVELLQLGNTGEVTQAIATDQLVAGVSATFRITQLVLEEGEDAYNVLCEGWEANPQISSVWYADRTWLDENPDLALAINLASLQSARWAAEDKDVWIEFATENIEGLTPEAAAIDYDTLVVELDNWPVNGSLDRELMEQTLETSLEFEAIPRAYTVDELATFEFQEQALKILGQE